MDRLYKEERESRERVWRGLREITEAEKQRRRLQPPPEAVEEGTREPLTVTQITQREPISANSAFATYVNRTPKLVLTYSALVGEFQRQLCSFCSGEIKDHEWSSYRRKDKDVPRWQPSHCTLYKLFDQIAQDIFPGQNIAWDSGSSHLDDAIRLDFNEVDEVGEFVAQTRIGLERDDAQSQRMARPKPESQHTSLPAMSIDQQLNLLKKWANICDDADVGDIEAAHQPCVKGRKLDIPSKRVLDLSAASKGLVYVVETEDRKGRYIALSHCWGNPNRHPLKTTHATLKAHLNGVQISNLPHSFRDAVRVCLYLDVQYLWIDCLCIVQDDSAEWLAEAEKMAEIYQGSYLTLAAARAQNSQHGFLFDFPAEETHYEITVDRPWDKDGSENNTLHATFKVDQEHSKYWRGPLSTRGWCLQEWYLPKRLVEFGHNDLRFICLRSVETRFGRTTDQNTKTRTIVRGFGIRDEPFFRQLWESIRDDFFNRELTKPSDMLPSLAGLAQLLEKVLLGVSNHRYLAGLWTTRLAEDLSWGVHDFETTTKSIQRVPTWSWASITASVGYIYGRPSKTFVDLIEARCTGYARPIEEPASLKVKGFIASMYLRVDHRHRMSGGRPSLSFWVDESSALNTTTEDVEAAANANRSGHYFVLDMAICPAPHDHRTIQVADETGIGSVPCIIRASENLGRCRLCTAQGYVAPVKLLLLTQTDVSVTVLVLSPVRSNFSGAGSSTVPAPVSEQELEGAYQRLGLLEIDCIKSYPYMQAADSLKIPAPTFWNTKSPSARKIITLV